MIEAKIIADSLNEQGQRLTTFVLKFPRMNLAEFNTHRMISKNSASSRAIPFEKMLELVEKDPFVPIKWMKDHSGMQGNEYYDGEQAAQATVLWLAARDEAVTKAKCLSGYTKRRETNEPIYEIEITKQFCNRLLEPFMWHTVIATGTEWENFFALRAHEAAEIHIQALAYEMLMAYNGSAPSQLKAGQWHIPFGDMFDKDRLLAVPLHSGGVGHGRTINGHFSEDLALLKVKIATARCARISYNTFEGKDDYEADIKLHDRLAASGHMSPFEHCARAMSVVENACNRTHTSLDSDIITTNNGWCGNFRGFIQYRKLFSGENKTDPRVVKHYDRKDETISQYSTNTQHE